MEGIPGIKHAVCRLRPASQSCGVVMVRIKECSLETDVALEGHLDCSERPSAYDARRIGVVPRVD